MPYEFYKVLHFIAIFATFLGLGAASLSQILNSGKKYKGKKLLTVTHGVGLLFILVSGFGLLARLGMTGGLPGWILIKLIIWLLLGAMMALIHKFHNKAKLWWFIILALGFAAAYLAVLKPTL